MIRALLSGLLIVATVAALAGAAYIGISRQDCRTSHTAQQWADMRLDAASCARLGVELKP